MLTLTENMNTRDKMREVQSKLQNLRLNRAEVRGKREREREGKVGRAEERGGRGIDSILHLL